MLEPLRTNYPSLKPSHWPAELKGNTIWNSKTKPPGPADSVLATAFADLQKCKPGILARIIAFFRGGIDSKIRLTNIAALDKFAETIQLADSLDETSVEWSKALIERRMVELKIDLPCCTLNSDEHPPVEMLRNEIGLYRGALINTCCHMTASDLNYIGFYDLCRIIGIAADPTIMVSISDSHTCRNLVINMQGENEANHGFLVIPLMQEELPWIETYYQVACCALDKITPDIDSINQHVANIDLLKESAKGIISAHDEMEVVVDKFKKFYPELTSPVLNTLGESDLNNSEVIIDEAVKEIIAEMKAIINGSTPHAMKRNQFLSDYNDYAILQDKLLTSFYSYLSFMNPKNHKTLGGQGLAFAQMKTDIEQRYKCWSANKDALEQSHVILERIKSRPEGLAGQPKLVVQFCDCMEELQRARRDASLAGEHLAQVQDGQHITCSMITPALTHANEFVEHAAEELKKMDGVVHLNASQQYKRGHLETLNNEAMLALHEAPIAIGDNGISLDRITQIMQADELYQNKYNEWMRIRDSFIAIAEHSHGGLISPHTSKPTPAMHFDWDWKTYRHQFMELYEKIKILDEQINHKYDETVKILEAED